MTEQSKDEFYAYIRSIPEKDRLRLHADNGVVLLDEKKVQQVKDKVKLKGHT